MSSQLEYKLGKSRYWLFRRWWLKCRKCEQTYDIDGTMHGILELVIPWWAWPFEIIHRMIFGYVKLERIDNE
jgi:hypothetical protein